MTGKSQLPQKSIGPYRLARQLGEDPAAEVWLAYTPDGVPVVVKRLAPALCHSETFEESFSTAERQLHSVRHPNVVNLRGVVHQEGSIFVVSDFVAGESLRVLEASQRLSPGDTCRIVIGLLEALACMHRQGLHHGDVKPENILVDGAGVPKVTDFAQVAVTGHGPPACSTPRYTSPEVRRGEPIDHRSDIYSVGAVLYEALTGRLPVPASNGVGFPPPIAPPELDLVLRRALAEDPLFRYQSAADFTTDLRETCVRSCMAGWGSEGTAAPAGGTTSSSEPRTASAHGPWVIEDDTRLAQSAQLAQLDSDKRRSLTRTRAVLACLLVLAVIAVVVWQARWPPGAFGSGEHVQPPSSIGSDGPISRTAANWSGVTAPASRFISPTGTNPDTFGSNFTPNTQLLSCPTPSFCVSIGSEARTFAATRGRLDTYASGTWTASEAPTNKLSPSASPTPVIQLNAVSCPAAGWCVVVGSYYDAVGARQGLIETLARGSWTDETAPGVVPSGTLDRVTCGGVGSCTAIGDVASTATLWTLSSGTWTSSPAPTLGLNPPSGTKYPPRLTDVSCASTTSCVAVGAYYSADDTELGLIESLSSGEWRASTAPLTTPQSEGGEEFSLEAVSCPTAAFCVSMGGAYDKLGYLHSLIETYSSGSWRSSDTPVYGLGLASSSPQWMYLTSLACSSGSFCVATGWYFANSSSGEVRSFILTDSSGSWMARTAVASQLDPASGSLDVVPLAASCGAPGTCVVVGTYYDNSGKEYGLIETLSGRRWSSATAPMTSLEPAAGGDPGLQLNAVSCPINKACIAIGVYQDQAGILQGVIERSGSGRAR
jgi:serine/threonine protein kinase